MHGHFGAGGMPKVRAKCHYKALILTIPVDYVKKSNHGKIRDVITIYRVMTLANELRTIMSEVTIEYFLSVGGLPH